MRKYINRIWRWAIERMLSGVYADDFHRPYNLNPEDWDDVAYRMICGFLGRDPK